MRLRAGGTLPKAKKKYAGELSEGRTGPGGPRVALLKPQTFMNEAGRSVGRHAARTTSTSTACWCCTTRSTCRSARSACGSAAGSRGTTG